MTSYILCGNPKGGCCPIVDIANNKDKVTITDDNKNVVTMTKEQYKIMCGKGCC